MPTVQISGNSEKGGIPRNATIRIEALPNKTLVFKGRVSKSITMNFDEGKYIYSVSKFTDEHQDDLKYVETFLVGMTENQFRKLSRVKPKVMKPFIGTEGVRYRCEFIGCSDEFTSRIAAVLHEAEHQGVNLLKEPERTREVAEKTDRIVEETRKKKSEKLGRPTSGRGRGRPRRGRPPASKVG